MSEIAAAAQDLHCTVKLSLPLKLPLNCQLHLKQTCIKHAWQLSDRTVQQLSSAVASHDVLAASVAFLAPKLDALLLLIPVYTSPATS